MIRVLSLLAYLPRCHAMFAAFQVLQDMREQPPAANVLGPQAREGVLRGLQGAASPNPIDFRADGTHSIMSYMKILVSSGT